MIRTYSPFSLHNRQPHYLIQVEMGKLFYAPRELLNDIRQEIQRGKQETLANRRIFRTNPSVAMQKFAAQIFGNIHTFSAQMGMLSNAFMAAGSLLGSPWITAFSLIGSTAAHIMAEGEAHQTERLDRTITQLLETTQQLEETNRALQQELTQLTQVARDLTAENNQLTRSNETLHESICSLQRTITTFESHLGIFERFNTSFGERLSQLNASLDYLRTNPLFSHHQTQPIEQLEQSAGSLQAEFNRFTQCFAQTSTILTQNQEGIHNKLLLLLTITEKISDQLIPLQGVQELNLIKRQLELALEGIQQYQSQLQHTEHELQQVRLRYDRDHIEIESSRRACGTMLHKMEQFMMGRSPK
ncbi:MAG: hypothetical protein NTZ52_00405 [Chlamydiae bacterium]|nr:hypothetical protein [Chlamydiota bacterium]